MSDRKKGKKDYYNILGINKAASRDDIKKAHRKLAKKYHPDSSDSRMNQEKFIDVQEAYETLSDGRKREDYDRESSSNRTSAARTARTAPRSREWNRSSWEPPLSIIDMFNSFFATDSVFSKRESSGIPVDHYTSHSRPVNHSAARKCIYCNSIFFPRGSENICKWCSRR